MASVSLIDLVPGGGWVNQVLGFVVQHLTNNDKQAVLDDLSDGMGLNELHSYQGTPGNRVGGVKKYNHVVGTMTLPPSGNWQCYGIFNDGGVQSQVTFQLTIDPNPNKTSRVLTIKSDINTLGGATTKTYTVKDCFFRLDGDLNLGGGIKTGSGEVTVIYHDHSGLDYTIIFNSQKKRL